jgi:hypothetical protein
MKVTKFINLNILVISAVVICFEIISTRISSVIFVQNYAFIILSLSIAGLGGGGIYSYYKIKISNDEKNNIAKIIIKYLILESSSLILFIGSIVLLNITNPFIYFILLLLPFFFAGIVYSQIFKSYAENSFKLYASDLIGAALGAVFSVAVFLVFSAQNAVLFLSVILFGLILSIHWSSTSKNKRIGFTIILLLIASFLIIYGGKDFWGNIPIGDYPEKDFYYTYDDPNIKSKIIESRWSINGRSDLVEYSHQDVVKQLFIDGAAGSQMFRFDGVIDNHDTLLNKLLSGFTTSVPFLFLNENEKNNMLVIGPGGGKEILMGLLGGVKKIVGVEVNRDFVDIVKKYKDYNGGIYTNFPNVKVAVDEGRHFVKCSKNKWDIILMALPSTEQLQSIDNLAANENYLLTVEALKDYFKILTNEGRLIFTVHNRWELVRLVVTTLYAFDDIGINNREALNHFIILGDDYAPTLVIKKNSFSDEEVACIKSIVKNLSDDLPHVTYLPYNWNTIDNTIENQFLQKTKADPYFLNDYIKNNPYNISPVKDDSPYFYKVVRGIPDDYSYLFIIVAVFCLAIIGVPFVKIKNTKKDGLVRKIILVPLLIFSCSGLGFMIIEVSFFQKLIVFIGSPTISLSVILTSLLIGMGTGSFFGKKLFINDPIKRIMLCSITIVLVGSIAFEVSQVISKELIMLDQLYRVIICFFLISPFGFLLGIPFPTAIEILKKNNKEIFLPWMYGVNGIFTVLGSITAVIISMLFGFTISFFLGLTIYLILFLIMHKMSYRKIANTH